MFKFAHAFAAFLIAGLCLTAGSSTSRAEDWKVKDGYLIFKRNVITVSTLIPAENYPAVKSFFERVRGADAAPVVLARK